MHLSGDYLASDVAPVHRCRLGLKSIATGPKGETKATSSGGDRVLCSGEIEIRASFL